MGQLGPCRGQNAPVRGVSTGTPVPAFAVEAFVRRVAIGPGDVLCQITAQTLCSAELQTSGFGEFAHAYALRHPFSQRPGVDGRIELIHRALLPWRGLEEGGGHP